MSDLVWMHHNEPMTTSEAIADGTGVQHKNVLELVRKFTSELLELCEALLRTSRAAGLSLPKALRQANAGTLRKTGVDMLKEIEAENHVAGLEAEHSAPPRAPIAMPEDPIEVAVVQWAQHVEPGTYRRMEQIIRETIGMEPKDRRWASMTAQVGRVLKRIGFSVKYRRIDGRVHRYWERKA